MYALVCRIDECGGRELFDSVEEINTSSWIEVNPLGGRADPEWVDVDAPIYRHRAYCEGHRLPADDQRN